MPKKKFPVVTIREDQHDIVYDLALALYGKKHGNISRFVREAIDEKIQRHNKKDEQP